jgi:hypothetical protein
VTSWSNGRCAGLVHGKEKWGCPFSNTSTEPGQIYRTLFVDPSSIYHWQKTYGSCDVYNRSSAVKYHHDWHHSNISRKNEGAVPSDLTMVVCSQAASPFAFFGNTTFSFFTNDTRNDLLQLRSRSRRYGTWTGSASAELINVNYDKSTGSAVTSSIELQSTSTAKVTCDDCYLYAGSLPVPRLSSRTRSPRSMIYSQAHIQILIPKIHSAARLRTSWYEFNMKGIMLNLPGPIIDNLSLR